MDPKDNGFTGNHEVRLVLKDNSADGDNKKPEGEEYKQLTWVYIITIEI